METNMKAITPLAALAVLAATSVLAQQPQMSMGAQTAVNLPEACRTAGQAGGHADMMQKMHSSMSQSMQSMQGMMTQMTETQKGLHQAMMSMNGPMMTGMMAKDADVAWICAMIPHHQGAIDMARAGLKGADNIESKKLAEETIQSQEKEIAKLVTWVEKNASRKSKNEAGGSKPQQ
jgi:uncharacterized protein (DUF305 family)